MKNKKILLLILFFLFFFNINHVSATEEDTKCGIIQEKIINYDTYTNELKTLDCNDISESKIASACTNLTQQRNLIITELMKAKEKKQVCKSDMADVDKIIDENKDRCGKIFDDSFNKFVNTIMTIFYILGPILLLLFGTLDFAKATASSDAKALKKAWQNFSKRAIATVLLFLVPVFVNFLISLNVSDKYISGNAYSCNFQNFVYFKKYNINFLHNSNNKNNKNNNSNVLIKGDGSYIWPLKKESVLITSTFGQRIKPSAGASRDHKGIDIGLHTGDNVYAVAPGKVITSSYVGSAGNMVQIETTDNSGFTFVTQYMHNSSLLVQVGDIVNMGDVIAKGGSTGESTGPHSHFGVYSAENPNIYYNPILFFYGGISGIQAIDESTNTLSSVDLIKYYSNEAEWLQNQSYDISTATYTPAN